MKRPLYFLGGLLLFCFVPPGDCPVPLGEMLAPLGDGSSKTGDYFVPLGDISLPLGDNDLPLGDFPLPLGDRLVPSGEIDKSNTKKGDPNGHLFNIFVLFVMLCQQNPKRFRFCAYKAFSILHELVPGIYVGQIQQDFH